MMKTDKKESMAVSSEPGKSVRRVQRETEDILGFLSYTFIHLGSFDKDVKATICWRQQINKTLMTVKDNVATGSHLSANVMHSFSQRPMHCTMIQALEAVGQPDISDSNSFGTCGLELR